MKNVLAIILMMIFGLLLVAKDKELSDAFIYMEVSNLCKEYGTECYTKIEYCDKPNAYTNGFYIFLCQETVDLLEPDELRGVLYHEVSHIILDHQSKISEYDKQLAGLPEDKKRFLMARYRNDSEMEADALAVELLIENNRPVTLIQSLHKTTRYSKQTFTHPSLIQREENIRKAMKRYGKE